MRKLIITAALIGLLPLGAHAQSYSTTTEPDGSVDTYDRGGTLIDHDDAMDQDEDQAVSEGLKPEVGDLSPGELNSPELAPPQDHLDDPDSGLPNEASDDPSPFSAPSSADGDQ